MDIAPVTAKAPPPTVRESLPSPLLMVRLPVTVSFVPEKVTALLFGSVVDDDIVQTDGVAGESYPHRRRRRC